MIISARNAISDTKRYSVKYTDKNQQPSFMIAKRKRSFWRKELKSFNAVYIFSERELAICYISVCRLSVCNAHAPYSAGWNFQECFFAIWYLGTRWHSRKILRRSSQGNLSVRGVKHNRGSQKITILDRSKAISRKRCKTGGKLLLITNRKSHTSFQLVPKSVTSNDLERRNGR